MKMINFQIQQKRYTSDDDDDDERTKKKNKQRNNEIRLGENEKLNTKRKYVECVMREQHREHTK